MRLVCVSRFFPSAIVKSYFVNINYIFSLTRASGLLGCASHGYILKSFVLLTYLMPLRDLSANKDTVNAAINECSSNTPKRALMSISRLVIWRLNFSQPRLQALSPVSLFETPASP